MLENNFYQPKDLPEEFLSYEQTVKQLGVGKTGKTGSLVMVLERDPHRKKTIATELFSKVPLQVQKILHIEESSADMAYVYIMSPSGGILQGDRLRIDIRLENEGQAHVTTQAATKIYRMKRNYATQMLNLSVGDGCYLEFVPDQMIPYKNARFYQCVKMQVHDNATAVYSEIITPGRVASGEQLEYDILYLKTIAMNQNSRLRFMDSLLLEPTRQKRFDDFIGSKSVFGSMYILTKKINADLLSDNIHTMLSKCAVIGSASVLPRHDGIFARMIANTANEIKSAIDIILEKIRRDILNKSFTGERKY
ncbi:MAG: urease accessory protein UreD [Nitrososphaerales archaeon]